MESTALEALGILLHVCWSLGLEKDINEFSGKPSVERPIVMGAWDFARLAVCAPGETSRVLEEIDDPEMPPQAACGCCYPSVFETGPHPHPREIALLESLKTLHPHLLHHESSGAYREALDTLTRSRVKSEILLESLPDPEVVPEYLSLQDVSDVLGISKPTTRKLITEGSLRAHRFGTSRNSPYRIAHVDLNSFLESSKVGVESL
jgi:excisionase family DNA binding protein